MTGRQGGVRRARAIAAARGMALALAALAVALLAGCSASGSGSIEDAVSYGEVSASRGLVLAYAAGNENTALQGFASDLGLSSYGQGIWDKQGEDGATAADAVVSQMSDELAADLALLLACEQDGVDTSWMTLPDADETDPAALQEAYITWQSDLATLRDEWRSASLEADEPTDEELRDAFTRVDERALRTESAFTVMEVTGWTDGADSLRALMEGLRAQGSDADADAVTGSVAAACPGAAARSAEYDSSSVSKEEVDAQIAIERLSGSEAGTLVAGAQEGTYYWVLGVEGDTAYTYDEAPDLARVQLANERLEKRVAKLRKKHELSWHLDAADAVQTYLGQRD